MDKLTLEQAIKQHICYGAKVEILNHYRNYVGLPYSNANGYYMLAGDIHMTYNGGSTGISIKQFRFCLRPLSYLTKEIEHKGEMIIPILELYKISIYDDIQDYKIVTRSNDFDTYVSGIRVLDSSQEYRVLSFSTSNGFATQECGQADIIDQRRVVLTANQMLLWQKLFEWHFDVFGLIEKGLAVDINTIESEVEHG